MYKQTTLYTIGEDENGKPDLKSISKIPDTDRGILIGDGVFETILILNRKLIYLNAHLRRLMISLKRVKINFNVDWERVSSFLEEDVLDSNIKTGALRLTITRGESLDYLMNTPSKPTIIVSIRELTESKPEIKLTSVGERKNELSSLAGIKTTNYLANLSALEEARIQKADEALILNTKGEVAEGSMSNFFMIKNNELLTPPIESGALPGITRSMILTLANTVGIQETVRTIYPEEILEADEIFMSSSTKGVIPVKEFDGKTYPGENGPWTQKLQIALSKEMEADSL